MSDMNSGNLKRLLQERRTPFICVLLVAATCAAYWQVSRFDLTNYDGPEMLLSNPLVFGGLTPQGLLWALTTSWFGYWHPVTWLSHMLAFELFGANPGWHHLLSLAIHITNSLLLFAGLRRMVLAGQVGKRLALYGASQPYREEAGVR
jgi:protein O-mannosyl-transferase